MPHLRTSPISARTYRHFAVITVAITATIAVFADGENRQALADRQERTELQQAQVAKFGKPKLIARHPRHTTGGGFQGYGDSFDSDYGKPMDGMGHAAHTAGTWAGRANPRGAVPGSYAPYGISQASWDAMSEEQREAFLRQRGATQPPVSAEQHQREVAGLLAASAARAGNSGEPDGD